MSGQIVMDRRGSNTSQLLEFVQELKREVASLRKELAEVRRENLILRQEAGYWKSRHADAVGRIAKLEAENEQLQGEIRQLQARLYGQKSEHSASRDRSNHLPGEEADSESLSPKRAGSGKATPVLRAAITAICRLWRS